MNEIKNRFTSKPICNGEETIFQLAQKNKANLSEANLSEADLSGADLFRANLFRANLSGANLSGANLSGADLSGANLSGANLFGADLFRANLFRANLSGADLFRANLSGANLFRAKGINKYLCTPLLFLRDQPNKIRAYKLINSKMEGPFNGGIKYAIDKTYEITDANQNETNQCGSGINLGTLDWCMKNWVDGDHILIAEFEAKDIACIPIATDGKFRVFRCTIVGEKNLKEIGLEA